ncbi:DUF2474 family protein [Endobacter medicaginis]|uniref:DUF2474 family protein n=1 Tax=Endobacter medicaginis TaxID=1181271 RepID=A0A850NN99_9PROT|nr:DUF2474 family protein [Endobacter medicaginis]
MTELPPDPAAARPLGRRLLWFVAIWAASVVVVAVVAEGMKRMILG